MDERNAMKLALACSAAGLLMLFVFSSWAEQSATPVKIGVLSLDDTGSSAKLCGNLTAVRVSNGHVFMQLDDGTGSMRVVAFNSTVNRISRSGSDISGLKKGGNVCAAGRLEEYPPGSGELEMVATKVF